jgi:hypothetical protein
VKTVVVQIGNSDNKLTQSEWAHFAAYIDGVISRNVLNIHFKGGSDWDAPWQNACWVAEIHQDGVADLRRQLAQERANWKQDSVAIVVGDTELV